jgi:hypothetical protein
MSTFFLLLYGFPGSFPEAPTMNGANIRYDFNRLAKIFSLGLDVSNANENLL